MPSTTNISILDITGYISPIFITLAILIGICSLILKTKKFNLFATYTIIALIFARFGMVFWLLSRGCEIIKNGYALPYIESLDVVISIVSMGGTTLLGCAIAILLIGISTLITKEPKIDDEI